MLFENKVVIVTGSSAGIGKATALAFAREGATVITNSRSECTVSEEIEALGGCSVFVKADVSTEQGAKTLVERAVECFGKIDIVANIAGIVPEGSVETCDEDEWDRVMQINAKSVYLMSHYSIPYLRQTKGCIVNITSTVAIKGVANRASYSASKGAVLSLSRSMAIEYVKEGIRVNCVCPGTVLSPSFEKRVMNTQEPEKAMENYISRQPMGRLGKPEEIAQAVLFAANPEVGFMTGANIIVDGAMTV
ncbi:MAG: SDR family NAD(P)-dependent oxidoreductase [Eubacteriales bacterium]|nr:SDR family NAD(P)-dependent oxidoreductase [Eubacteriales bacterium]